MPPEVVVVEILKVVISNWGFSKLLLSLVSSKP